MGFLDVVLPFGIKNIRRGNEYREYFCNRNDDGGKLFLAEEKEKLTYEDTVIRYGILPIEVKIESVGIGDVIRQIEFYREYISFIEDNYNFKNVYDESPPIILNAQQYMDYLSKIRFSIENWILVTDFEILESDLKQLQDHSITYFKLGPQFEEFCKNQQKTKTLANLI